MPYPLSTSMPTSFCLYAITVLSNNILYAVQPSKSGSGQQLELATYDPKSLEQQWMFVLNNTFQGYSIFNAAYGYCIDAAGNSKPTGPTVVQQYVWQEQKNQAWDVVQQSTGSTQFQFASPYASNMIWNVKGGKIGSGYKIQLYPQDLKKPSSNQFFNLIPAANQYGCDLGFDWASAAASASTTSSLQFNLMSKPYNCPAWLTQFNVGDYLTFYLYDISTLNNPNATTASSAGSVSIDFKMNFSTANGGSVAQPLGTQQWNTDDDNYQITTSCCTGPQYSQAFGMTLPVFMIGGTASNNNPIVWQFSSQGNYNFVLTATVTVTPTQAGNAITRTFVFDPEMLVGPAT